MTEEKRKEDILKQYEELPKGVVKYIDFLITKINKLVVENKRKQAQIEKMKCCGNCVHYHKYFNKLYYECFFEENGNGEICENKDLWELKE